jgi:hypothetical protein
VEVQTVSEISIADLKEERVQLFESKRKKLMEKRATYLRKNDEDALWEVDYDLRELRADHLIALTVLDGLQSLRTIAESVRAVAEVMTTPQIIQKEIS